MQIDLDSEKRGNFNSKKGGVFPPFFPDTSGPGVFA